MKSDADLQKDVMAELKYEPRVNSAHINVESRNGAIKLTGNVNTYPERNYAVVAAKRVAGVKAVTDEIEVKLSKQDNRSDSDITTAATNALKWHANIPEDRIKIAVEKGRVTLDGEVDWQYQRTQAESAIRYLRGVISLGNRIKVKPTNKPDEVKSQIEAAFRRQARNEADRVNILAAGAKVTLTGELDTLAHSEEIERAAWSAPGVKEVENRITVL